MVRTHLPKQEMQNMQFWFICELGRSPGGRDGNPLQYSCLENPVGRGSWQATVQRVKESDTLNPTEQLGTHKVIRILFEAYIKF